MTSLNTQPWELITNHQMPDEASGRPFIQQLMDGHGIAHQTAICAVEEYKKFMYLCATRSERNVPSKAVDLVWHLHMQHSRDYWDVFCKKLGKPVHHSPGGEGATHLNDYKATVAAYKLLFGSPPKGIWRQSSFVEKLIPVVSAGVLLYIGIGLVGRGDAALLQGLIFLGLALFSIVKASNLSTAQGEFTLIFENDTPFADDDAGDCGSDGGGCGD